MEKKGVMPADIGRFAGDLLSFIRKKRIKSIKKLERKAGKRYFTEMGGTVEITSFGNFRGMGYKNGGDQFAVHVSLNESGGYGEVYVRCHIVIHADGYLNRGFAGTDDLDSIQVKRLNNTDFSTVKKELEFLAKNYNNA